MLALGGSSDSPQCRIRRCFIGRPFKPFPKELEQDGASQRPTKYYLSHARPLQPQSRCTKTVLPFSRFFANRHVRSKLTGMGNILATVALAVPLISWLCGTLLLSTSRLRLARVPSAPRGNTPTPWDSNSSRARIRPARVR